jgi:hypothetical protein
MMAAAPPHDSTTVRTIIIPTEGVTNTIRYSQPKDANAGKSKPSVAAARHGEFYFTDEMTVFQVCSSTEPF